jgi:hypothetical protein
MADLFTYQTLKRKPRKGQRVRIPPKKEWLFQQDLVRDLIEPYLRRDWRYTHVPSGELRDDATAGKLKGMGVKPGFFDLLFLSPEGRYFWLELKRVPTKRLKGDQLRFQQWLDQHSLPYAVAWTTDQAYAALERWGALRIQRVGGTLRVD